MNTRYLPVVALGMTLGCRVGPDYERPDYPIPETHRGAESPESGEDVPETTLGDVEWLEIFSDPALQDLVRRALVNNYDVRIAAERILEARARVTITRSERFPQLNAVGAFESAKGTENGTNQLPPGLVPKTEEFRLVGDLSWEIDFWGRIASATEAARADLLATELSRRIVIQTLVTDIAVAYFDLIEFDTELEISRRSYQSRKESYDLVDLRLQQGVANKVELRQAESLVLQTAVIIPELERQIRQQENLLSVLVGGNPGEIERGSSLLDQQQKVEIPVGLPSELLQRRPDILAAEQSLIAANALIGEARARLYPTLRLTAVGGVASQDLGDLFESGSDTWSITPSITQPIFNAGALRSNVEVTKAQQRQAALAYQQTLQLAFAEVADALISREKSAEIRTWQQQLEEALNEQVGLSRERYRGGVTSYLEFLDSERQHFDAELQLVRAIRNELVAFVAVYRSLGGGWQGAEELAVHDIEAAASSSGFADTDGDGLPDSPGGPDSTFVDTDEDGIPDAGK